MTDPNQPNRTGQFGQPGQFGQTGQPGQFGQPGQYGHSGGAQQPDPTRLQPAWQQPDWQQPSWQQSQPPQQGYQQPGHPQPNFQQPGYQQPNFQQPNFQQPQRKGKGPIIAAVLAAVLVIGAVVTFIVIRNQDPEGTEAAPPSSTSAGSEAAMTSRTIGPRMLPPLGETSAGETTEPAAEDPTQEDPTQEDPTEEDPSVATRPTDSDPDPQDGPGSATFAVGDCLSVTDYNSNLGVTLTELDCNEMAATYLVQAIGPEECDAYEVTVTLPDAPDDVMCLDFNVQEGDCLQVGDETLPVDAVIPCDQAQGDDEVYQVLLLDESSSDPDACPAATEVALPNETRNRLICLGQP